MKKLFLSLFVILVTFSAYSQFDDYPRQNQGEISGGLGLNWIDGELYYTLHFTPEISFANFGVGLDLRFDVNKEGNLRTENFNEASDYLSIIRYLRYGLKNDPFYAKLGALDYYTLGHGSLMYRYNNSPTFDARKIGLVLDIDFGTFGFESIFAQFSEFNVVGFRGYVRPLQFTSLGSIPVIGNVEVGATYAADYHEHAGVLAGSYNSQTNEFETRTDAGSINIVGVDVGLPLLSTGLLNVELYTDFTQIIDFGNGVATGIILDFGGMGLVQATAKLERRFNGDQYIPAYFNSLYEIERLKILDKTSTVGEFDSKAKRLALSTDGDDGYYGELEINVLGLFYVIGSYQRLDKTPESGILHLSTEIAPEDFPFVARAGYDKVNIKGEGDLFKLDDRSYLFSELGYKPYPFMLVSMVYHWTFTPVRDINDNIVDFEPQKRIEPRISFIYPFNF